MSPDEIIAAARECLGTPFRHQGRLPGVGLDCAGVAVHVARRLGLVPQDSGHYGRLPVDGQLQRQLDQQPFLRQRASASDRLPGDLLLMRFTGEPQHLAILAHGTMIHAWEGAGKCCEHDLTLPWRGRIVAVYAFVNGAESE